MTKELISAKAEALDEAADAILTLMDDGADADASPEDTVAWLRYRAAELRTK